MLVGEVSLTDSEMAFIGENIDTIQAEGATDRTIAILATMAALVARGDSGQGKVSSPGAHDIMVRVTNEMRCHR